MKRLIAEPVSEEHYTADACIVWCLDARFSHLLESFLKHEEMAHVDLLKVAGGARGLASRATDAERDYLLNQIETSLRLHKTPIIVLMVHAGCGAYDQRFSRKDEEEKFYSSELGKARAAVSLYLRERGIAARVLAYYADFEGLIEIEP